VSIPRRIPAFFATALAALAVLVVAHNLVFFLQYGADYGRNIATTGDGPGWNETVRVVLVASSLLAIAATARILYLLRLLRRLDDHCQVGRIPWPGYGRLVAIESVRLFAISLALFVAQENAERWAAGLRMPGVAIAWMFGAASPIAIFSLVSLVFAAVLALFRLSLHVLEALVARRLGRRPRPTPAPRHGWREPLEPAGSTIGRKLASRAPPRTLPA
jgi:hypothetical protein